MELRGAHLTHYDRENADEVRMRLGALVELTLQCVAEGCATPIAEHAKRIGWERFIAGYELSEIQTSINVLEEALWKRILASVGPEEVAGAIGKVNAIFGITKDVLAQTYVKLAATNQKSN